MISNFIRAMAVVVLMLAVVPGWTQNPKHCADSGPPSIWVVKSPYPFQAGSERTFDELYHGPWKARVDIALYAMPRAEHVVGKVKSGTVVQANAPQPALSAPSHDPPIGRPPP